MTSGRAAALRGIGAERVAVRVPATSANLGPGFDSFGLALSLHDRVGVTATRRGLDIEVSGEGSGGVAVGEQNLVVRALRSTLDVLGVPQPGLRLRCRNCVPHTRGLGSSSAAIVAGIRLAEALATDSVLTPGQDLELAAALEGHADNVAACLRGGFTVAWAEPAGAGGAVPADLSRPTAQEPSAGAISDTGSWFLRPQAEVSAGAVRLDVHPDVRPVVFIPPATLSTDVARSLLPTAIRHADASRATGRAGLLVAALTAYPEHLLAATEDWLHQEYRRAAMTATMQLIDRLRAARIAAVVSGAGPAVLALGTTDFPVEAAHWTPPGWRALALSVDSTGAVTGMPHGRREFAPVQDSGRR